MSVQCSTCFNEIQTPCFIAGDQGIILFPGIEKYLYIAGILGLGSHDSGKATHHTKEIFLITFDTSIEFNMRRIVQRQTSLSISVH